MAKKRITFWRKVKILGGWLFDIKRYGITTTCGFCRSTKIKLLDGVDEGSAFEDGYEYSKYKGKYMCSNCGGVGVNNETWTRLKK
jgi:hypothetical protein